MLVKGVRASADGADNFTGRNAATPSLVAEGPATVTLLEDRLGFEALHGDSLSKEGRGRADERRNSLPVRVDQAENDGGVTGKDIYVDFFLEPMRGG
jgi:hypothetical protein